MTLGFEKHWPRNSLFLPSSSCEPYNSDSGVTTSVSQLSQGCCFPKTILGAEEESPFIDFIQRLENQRLMLMCCRNQHNIVQQLSFL